jgi:YVTN family beta-propeller protein
LFVTLNGADQVVAVNTATGQVVQRTTTGSQPRSMAISADGQALYVVNYLSNTVSILRASDLLDRAVLGRESSDRDRA